MDSFAKLPPSRRKKEIIIIYTGVTEYLLIADFIHLPYHM